jgi:hypothetical protein
MKAWTDYPIKLEESGKEAPVRECKVLSYDSDKYCEVSIDGITFLIKACYIYSKPGRLGEVPSLTRRQLYSLPETKY